MLSILIIVLADILLGGLLYYEKENNQKGRLASKPALSSLFIIAVLTQPPKFPNPHE